MSRVRHQVMYGFAVTLAVVSSIVAAEPSFTGTWKLNPAKSQLAGQTVSLQKTASGGMHFDSEGFGYDFNLDGKAYPTPDGGTTAWRALNATTWEVTNRMNGKVIVTFRMSLSGDSITSVMSAPKPDGGVVDQKATWTRISGGPAFLGKWKTTEVKGAPTSIEIATEGPNGLTLKYPEFQTVCKGSFDGKDYAVVTAGLASKQTFSFEKSGPNAIKITTKLNGKPLYVDVFTLSADGKTLIDDGNAISVNEPIKAVYEKQ
jgi:hypothetical protein